MERQELWDDLHRRDELRVERDRRLYEQEQEKWCYLQKVLPLPQRAVPRPWEDLASLLSRTANKMGYDHPRWLLHQENIPYAINSATLSVLHRRTDYLFLGRQMLLEEEQLYALTLHRFTSRLYLPQHSPPPSATYSGDRRSIDRPRLWYEDQQRFFLSEIYTRVCPLCLDEGDGRGGYDLQTVLVRQESLASVTYNRRLAALRSFTRWLREQGWVADTLLDGMKRKPEEKRTARALDAQQVESVLRTIEDPRDRALQAASLPPLWNGLPAQSTDGALLEAFAGNTSPRELIPNSCLPSLHTLLEHLCPKNVPKRSASDNICGTKVGQ